MCVNERRSIPNRLFCMIVMIIKGDGKGRGGIYAQNVYMRNGVSREEVKGSRT